GGARNIGERVEPQLLVGTFLDEVRKLIEEHPDVAATCTASPREAGEQLCRIYATRPVRMGRAMEEAFIEGFSAAGLRQITAGRSADVLVPESWPPALMVTEGREGASGAWTLPGQGM